MQLTQEKPEDIETLTDRRITAIIVNFNGSSILDDCIRTLIEQTRPCFEILLVDNGSTDDSVEVVRTKYPTVRIAQCGTNQGFAEGNNLGSRIALGDYVVMVNTDARLHEHCLEKLFDAFARNPDLAVVQGKVLHYGSDSIVDSVGSLLTPTGFLFHRQYGKPDSTLARSYVFSAKGVCMMMPRRVYNDLGGFDRDFFAYFEESDLCWRAWVSGYKVMFVPSSVAYHIGGATSSKFPKEFVDFHSFKNRICSIIKNCELRTLFFMLPLHVVLCLLIAIGFATKRQRPRAVGILKALNWNAQNLSLTLRKRRIIQLKLRRVDDRKIFSHCMASPGLSYFRQLLSGYGA